MKLSQSELAEKAGLSSATIGRLERDETRWGFITDETFDKLTKVFEEIQGFAFVKVHESNSTNIEESEETINVEEEKPKMEETLVEVEEKKEDDNNAKTLVLLQFAFEGLKESESNEDFKANLKLIKRVVDSY